MSKLRGRSIRGLLEPVCGKGTSMALFHPLEEKFVVAGFDDANERQFMVSSSTTS